MVVLLVTWCSESVNEVGDSVVELADVERVTPCEMTEDETLDARADAQRCRTVADVWRQQTGKSVEQVLIDNDRDNWFTAQEALEYGFVDHLREHADEVVGGGGTDEAVSNADATGKKD